MYYERKLPYYNSSAQKHTVFFIGFVRADFRFDILTLYSGLLDLLCSVDTVLPIYSLSVRVVDWMRKDLCAHNSLVVLVLLNPSENLK